MGYRPITDIWILARPKVRYYGAYPAGFLGRARALLGVTIDDPVLHVCSGKVLDYPYSGVGARDMTLDLDPALKPDYLQDAREPLPKGFKAILADPPYTDEDADHYVPTHHQLPSANALLKNMLLAVKPGHRVGMLHYVVPRPPKDMAKFVAVVGVFCGFGNKMRAYSVFERV
jgi:hypothetical protein